MAFEPLVGKRYIEITNQRRREEWARVMQKVVGCGDTAPEMAQCPTLTEIGLQVAGISRQPNL